MLIRRHDVRAVRGNRRPACQPAARPGLPPRCRRRRPVGARRLGRDRGPRAACQGHDRLRLAVVAGSGCACSGPRWPWRVTPACSSTGSRPHGCSPASRCRAPSSPRCSASRPGRAAALALTALLGLVFAVPQPAEFALVPPLAGTPRPGGERPHRDRALHRASASAPARGGFVFPAGGLELAMLIDAATFAAVAVAALALRCARDPRTPRRPSAPPRARDGLAFLFGDRVLSLAMIVAFSSLLFMSAVWVGELFFVQDVLGRGDVGLRADVHRSGPSGWRSAPCCCPAPSGRRRGRRHRPCSRSPSRASGLALPALWLSFGFFLACSFVGGLAHGVKNVMFRSLIHVRVPEHLHGRAFAAYNGIRNSAELGAFAAGGLLVDGDRPARHARLRGRPLGARRARRAAPGPAAHATGGGSRPARSGRHASTPESSRTSVGIAPSGGRRGRASLRPG